LIAFGCADLVLILVAQQEQSRKYDEANALKQVHEPAQVQNAAKPLLR
jgi:hypothetical protein